MSSNTTSNVQNSTSSERRVAFHYPVSTTVHSTDRTNVEKIITPLEAALAVSSEYIATLHFGLTTYLSDLVEKCLKEYATFFYAHEKHRGMRLNTASVPPSVRKIKLTLLPVEEVRESEDFMALQAELAAETEALQRKWADKYTIVVDAWNCNALRRRVHLSICKTLRKTAEAFIAQLGVSNYSEDEAVIDCLATSNDDILATPLSLDITTFLRLYKEANNLQRLPQPTTQIASAAYLKAIDEANNTTSYPADPATTTNLPPVVVNTGENNSMATYSSLSTTPPNALQLDHGRTPSATENIPGQDNTPAQNNTIGVEQHRTTIAQPQPLAANAALLATPTLPAGRSSIITPGTSIRRERTGTTTESSSTTASSNTRTRSIPILYQGKPTGYYKQAPLLPDPPLPEPQQQQQPPGQAPRFDYSPLTRDTSTHPFPSSFSQGENGDLDAALAAVDMDDITNTAARGTIQKMLNDFFINAVKNSIAKFHTFVTQREELNRIRHLTTKSPMESLATKVAAKIHNEQPAERPVLAGLIHEVTDKALSGLKRQFQSVADQLSTNTRKLNALQAAKKRNTDDTRSSTPKRSRQSKNSPGGNLTWSKAQSTNLSSSAAAEDSSTSRHQNLPLPQAVYNNTTNPMGKANAPNVQRKNSHEADANANAARRRKQKKQQQKNKLQMKDNNLN